MPKLFCVSDIHGFYDELIEALDNAGFDKNNEDHWLIVCGDVWDRGSQPIEVMTYLQKLPRKVLVKGNHESLFQDLCEKGYPGSHDFSNGTYDTVCEFGNAGIGNSFDECCIIAHNRTKNFIESMVNYFETKNYIFVHSFVPLKCLDDFPTYYTRGRVYEKMDNWREAHYSDWEAARWGNPFDLAKRGLLPNKTLVFGHWHTSWPRHNCGWSDEVEPEFGEGADFSPYYGDGYIAIDGCCAYSGKVNVLVLEDEFLEE